MVTAVSSHASLKRSTCPAATSHPEKAEQQSTDLDGTEAVGKQRGADT